MSTATHVDEPIGLINILVIEGKNLPALDMTRSSDPFCVLSYGEVTQRTTIKKRTLAPKWSETFNFLVTRSTKTYTVKFDAWDWDRTSKNDLMGTTELDCSPLWDGQEHLYDLGLVDKKGKGAGSIVVKARIRTEQEIQQRFWRIVAKRFDTDGSGALEKLELSALVHTLEGSLTEAEIDAMYREIDTDKDDKIKLDELVAWAARPGNTRKLTGREDMVWKLSVFLEDEADAPSVLHDVDRYLGAPAVTPRSGGAWRIMVRERKSGHEIEEKISSSIKTVMLIMYSNVGGRKTVGSEKIKNLLKHLTETQGHHYEEPKSKAQIRQFIEYHQLNTDEIDGHVEDFATFNQFFYRKLKSNARPIEHASDRTVAVSPADCRLSAYQTLAEAQKLWIKGETFSLKNLLHDDQLAAEFTGCSVVIARLSPQDYHRFHTPIDGVVGPMKPIDGTYYTVNPIAVRENVDVYGENKRQVTWIENDVFGKVLFVAVGATMVGSIIFTATPGQRVKKGEEMGYFAFGGSTVLLFFKQGAITLDYDLTTNSSRPIETLVKMGFSIGKH